MCIYLFIYSTCISIFYLGNRFKSNFSYFLALVILILFGGLRYEIGQDYNTYSEIFKYAETTNVEYGYLLLCVFFKTLGLGPQIMYLISISITLFLLYKSILFYNSRQIAFIFFIFLFAGYYAESFNAVRQYIAIAFFIYATRYIFAASLCKFCFYLLIGSLFHTSILFLIPFYYILKKQYSDTTLLICGGGILIFAFIFPITPLLERIPVYGQRYMIDHSEFNQSANLGLGYISKLCIALILIKMRHYIIKIDKKYNVVINAYFFYVLFMAIFKDMMVFLRIAYYFHIFLILILPKMTLCLNKRSQPIGILITCLYALLLFFIQMTDEKSMLIPYQANLNFTIS